MKRKTRILKVGKEPWSRSDIINSALAILTFAALIITGISTCISKNGLDLQQRQFIEFQKKDSLSTILDSVKNKKAIELAQKQIDALEAQVEALNEGVENTIWSQSPNIHISEFGFWRSHPTNPDSVILAFHIKNDGVRSAYLSKVKVFVLNKDFKFALNPIFTPGNNVSIKGNGITTRIKLPFNTGECLKCNINDILKIGNLHFCVILEYYDSLKSKNKGLYSKHFIYSWKIKEKTDLVPSSIDNLILYSVDLCTNKDDIVKIFNEINSYPYQ